MDGVVNAIVGEYGPTVVGSIARTCQYRVFENPKSVGELKVVWPDPSPEVHAATLFANVSATSAMSGRSSTPAMAVRRLTPRECERLQGFPDDYTLVPFRGKPAADGNRYKALGNSMAVPVMRWLGERIGKIEETMPIRLTPNNARD